MGTSLFNTTPQATYPSLIKLGDNLPLTATLKALSDGLGNDSVLALSTISLQIGGATGATWDNTNKRLGIGTSAPTTALEVAYNSSTLNGILINQLGASLDSSIGFANAGVIRSSLSMNINTGECRWTASSGGYFPTIYSSGVERFRIATSGNVGIGETAPTARLQVKGSGATSATTSLLVQNSAGTAALTVKDDLSTTFGGTIGSGGSSNLIIAAGNASVEVQTTNPNIPTGSIITTGAITRTDSGVKNIIDVNNAVTSTAASFNTLNGFAFTSTISQTLGTIRGIYIAPTLTASTDFRGIETTVGNVLLCTTSGKVGIGETTPTARLQVKGSGATSATTSFLVQDSAGNAALTIKDDLTLNVVGILGTGGIQNIMSTNNNLSFGAGYYYRLFATADANSVVLGSNYDGSNTYTYAERRFVVGSSSINASAALQADSTTKGFLPPRMTTTQKNAIATPAAGLMVYDSTLAKLCVYTTAWETVTSL
jgi:hypothetical protein